MKKIIIAATALVLYSCSKSGSNPASNTISPFTGTWSGTYTGNQDHGTFSIVINTNGLAQGSAISQVFTDTFQLAGKAIANGNITLAIDGLSDGSSFIGVLSGNAGDGTWINKAVVPNYSGDWYLTKQ